MEKSKVELINQEVNQELANPAVARALLATTFKGLTPVAMKQACLEGMIRGFTFKDFLEKNIYAVPFGQGYSLVTSIDYTRKVAMRSGLVGKSAPTYTMDEKGNIETCTITVKKKVSGEIGEFTATVYFSEYDTGRNTWKTKPRTMIAKVAEMHALRSAFPEEIAQQYSEEEMELETRVPKVAEAEAMVENNKLSMGNFAKTNETKKTKTDENGEPVIEYPDYSAAEGGADQG